MSLPSVGFTSERRPIDLRTFLERDDALAAPDCSDRTLELICVGDLESLVDRKALLGGPESVEPPYWALPWIGARAIAADLLTCPLRSEHAVLDLGCGLGLSGVVAGLSGAHVLFADYVEDALMFARANAELHRLRSHDARCIDFTCDRLGSRFDVILAADVVYDPSHYAPLVEFLDTHLASDGMLLLTESLRADARRVLDLLAERGISGEKCGVWVREEGRPERTWLHTLRRS